MSKQKKSQIQNAKRLLISINVLGSAGPIRFVVNEEELVAAVIDTALKSYAREGRLPVLGNNTTGFALYCPHLGSDGTFTPLSLLNWIAKIGFLKIWIFKLLCCGCKIFSELNSTYYSIVVARYFQKLNWTNYSLVVARYFRKSELEELLYRLESWAMLISV